jgi:trimeric autotransporter adhesin
MRFESMPETIAAALRTARVLAAAVFASMALLGCGPGPDACSDCIFAPHISSLLPATAVAGGSGLTLTVDGSNFTPASEVNWNGGQRNTTYVSSTRLTAVIGLLDLQSSGTAVVTVVDPTAPTSNSLNFTIGAPFGIGSLSPSAVVAGSGAFTLTVDGSGFVADSQVQWNGSPRPTVFASATQLVAAIAAADVASAGSAAVTVANPSAAGGASSPASFTISASVARGIIDVIAQSTSQFIAANDTQYYEATLSATGRFAVFASLDNYLVDPPTTASQNAFLHDSCLGASACSESTSLVSAVSRSTTELAKGGDYPSVSADGRFVALRGTDNQLQFAQQAYLRDTCIGAPDCTQTTTLASLTDSGNRPSGSTTMVALSASGRYVAFQTSATDVLPGIVTPLQVYVRDTCRTTTSTVAGCNTHTFIASLDSNGQPDNQGAAFSNLAISANGRFVAFQSTGTNLPGAPGANALAVYVADMCFNVAGCIPSTRLVSLDSSAMPSVSSPGFSLSDDGRVVAFSSLSALAPGAVASLNNIYLRDTCLAEAGPIANCAPSTVTVSVASDGGGANASSNFGLRAVSGNGRFVVFNSQATNLVAGGTPADGVYVRDTCLAAPSGCVPSTHLVSIDGRGQFDPTPPADANATISADGHYCAFKALFLPDGMSLPALVLAPTTY